MPSSSTTTWVSRSVMAIGSPAITIRLPLPRAAISEGRSQLMWTAGV